MSTAITCSLSGSLTVNPVVSIKTGHVFEHSTISKHISVYGTCPHTHQPLTEADLIPLAANRNPIIPAPQYSDTDAIIKKIQQEYEALVLETNQLKNGLREAREELAHGLYRQDASIRVVAKLNNEVKEAQQELAKTLKQIRERELLGQ